ncbi:MAG: hypothetical protein US70_C0017G0006 [Parcubacteria group bacterium GW2011_GWD2_38_11]|nr:MAG: hypothetical protein US70_C0017G0006 [Parcubacteria group bacterium GW2011_GWD2_38_11]
MHKQHHKMHIEEMAFHIAVPVVILSLTVAMGYYVLTLVTDIMKMA